MTADVLPVRQASLGDVPVIEGPVVMRSMESGERAGCAESVVLATNSATGVSRRAERRRRAGE